MKRVLFPLTAALAIMAVVLSLAGIAARRSQAGEARPDTQRNERPPEQNDPRRWRGRPISPRILVINYDPIIEAEGGRRLHEVCGWNDPRKLTQGYIDDVRETSGGYVRYRVVD